MAVSGSSSLMHGRRLDAAAAGHRDVEQADVRALLARERDRLLPVGRLGAHFEATGLEGLAHARARRRVVVGDEHASGLGVRFAAIAHRLGKHRGSAEPPVT